MAKSTYGTILEYRPFAERETSNFQFLCDIKNTPSFMPEVNRVETTTLSDAVETNVLGIGRFSDFDFTVNVEDDNNLVGWKFDTLLGLKGMYEFRVESFKDFKKTVEGGVAKFSGTPFFTVTWSGEAIVGLNESEVDGINEGTISISTSSTPVIKMGQPTEDPASKDVTLGTKPTKAE